MLNFPNYIVRSRQKYLSKNVSRGGSLGYKHGTADSIAEVYQVIAEHRSAKTPDVEYIESKVYQLIEM